MLYILRRVSRQRSFLVRLLSSGTDWHRQRTCVDYPVVFLQNFAEVFKVEMQIHGSDDWQPMLINVRIFLDFYLKHGIKLIAMRKTDSGRWIVEITPSVQERNYLPLAGIFDSQVVVQVVQSQDGNSRPVGNQVGS